MDAIETVGKSGQISVGKALAGMEFIPKAAMKLEILLLRSRYSPRSATWLERPVVTSRPSGRAHCNSSGVPDTWRLRRLA